jgi:C1A family cysteine protease
MEQIKINRENISQHLMEYQLQLANKSVIDVIRHDNWRFELTLTRTQHEEFKKYAIKLIQKIFKINKLKATNTFTFFDNEFGLRISGI